MRLGSQTAPSISLEQSITLDMAFVQRVSRGAYTSGCCIVLWEDAASRCAIWFLYRLFRASRTGYRIACSALLQPSCDPRSDLKPRAKSPAGSTPPKRLALPRPNLPSDLGGTSVCDHCWRQTVTASLGEVDLGVQSQSSQNGSITLRAAVSYGVQDQDLQTEQQTTLWHQLSSRNDVCFLLWPYDILPRPSC